MAVYAQKEYPKYFIFIIRLLQELDKNDIDKNKIIGKVNILLQKLYPLSNQNISFELFQEKMIPLIYQRLLNKLSPTSTPLTTSKKTDGQINETNHPVPSPETQINNYYRVIMNELGWNTEDIQSIINWLDKIDGISTLANQTLVFKTFHTDILAIRGDNAHEELYQCKTLGLTEHLGILFNRYMTVACSIDNLRNLYGDFRNFIKKLNEDIRCPTLKFEFNLLIHILENRSDYIIKILKNLFNDHKTKQDILYNIIQLCSPRAFTVLFLSEYQLKSFQKMISNESLCNEINFTHLAIMINDSKILQLMERSYLTFEMVILASRIKYSSKSSTEMTLLGYLYQSPELHIASQCYPIWNRYILSSNLSYNKIEYFNNIEKLITACISDPSALPILPKKLFYNCIEIIKLTNDISYDSPDSATIGLCSSFLGPGQTPEIMILANKKTPRSWADLILDEINQCLEDTFIAPRASTRSNQAELTPNKENTTQNIVTTTLLPTSTQQSRNTTQDVTSLPINQNTQILTNNKNSAAQENINQTQPQAQQTQNNILSPIRKGLKNKKMIMDHFAIQSINNITLGEAINDGDCFFDSLLQALKNTNKDIALKKLRELCYSYYQANKQMVDDWNKADYGGIDKGKNEYYFVQYTAQECIKYFHDRAPIWGRPYVEGRILCHQLNLEGIGVIETLEDPETKNIVPSYHLVTKEGYKGIDEAKFKFYLQNKNIPCLVVEQGSLHFVPLQRKNENTVNPEIIILSDESPKVSRSAPVNQEIPKNPNNVTVPQPTSHQQLPVISLDDVLITSPPPRDMPALVASPAGPAFDINSLLADDLSEYLHTPTPLSNSAEILPNNQPQPSNLSNASSTTIDTTKSTQISNSNPIPAPNLINASTTNNNNSSAAALLATQGLLNSAQSSSRKRLHENDTLATQNTTDNVNNQNIFMPKKNVFKKPSAVYRPQKKR